MFVKLNGDFDFGDPTSDGVIFMRYPGITYYTISDKTEQEILSVVPEQFRGYFNALSMVITNEYVNIHTDSFINVSINFYVKTCDAVTKFYNIIDSTGHLRKIPEQTDGRVFAPHQVKEHSSFCAKPHEGWILNVKQPHSVHCTFGSERTAFVLQSAELTYEQVKSIINI